MKKTLLIAAVAAIACASSAFAQVSIKAEVDKTDLSTDDTLTYKLIITSTQKDIPRPQLPSFTKFEVLSEAQSSTFSFVKSEIRTILVYTCILLPKEAGTLKIGPSSVKDKDQIYSTQELEIKVIQGKQRIPAQPPAPSEPNTPQPEPGEQVTL